MTKNKSTISTLHELLDYDARSFIIAEVQLKRVLPGWIEAAGSFKLKTVLQKYLDLVQQHVNKMGVFIQDEDINLLNTGDRIMTSFIEETNSKLDACTDTVIKDACLLAGIQSINHYKICIYGTAAAFAKALNMDKPAAIFHDAEINEKQIDDRLTQLAEYEINFNARNPIAIQG